VYYAIWWEGKTVQKKALTKILAETLAPLLLGIDIDIEGANTGEKGKQLIKKLYPPDV
jgi:hypothetical protein